MISLFRWKTRLNETILLSFFYFVPKPRLFHQKTNNENNKQNPIIMHPYFLTGFADGESTFAIRLKKNNKMKIG